MKRQKSRTSHINKKLKIKRVRFSKQMLLLLVIVFAVFGAYIIYRSLAAGTASYAAFPSSSLAKSKDGRIHVFVRGTDGKVYFRSQTAPNSSTFNPWATPVSYDTFQATSSIAAVNFSDGKIALFARGTNNALYLSVQSTTTSGAGGWHGWRTLGGCVSSDPSAIKNANGLMQVFVRGCDNAVYTAKQTNINLTSFSSWIKVGGSVTSNITPSLRPDGKLEIFVRGTDPLTTDTWNTLNVYTNVQTAAGGNFGSFSKVTRLRGFASSNIATSWSKDTAACTDCKYVRGITYSSPNSGPPTRHIGILGQEQTNNTNYSVALYSNSNIASNPSIIDTPTGTHIFTRGTDKALYYYPDSAQGSNVLWALSKNLGGVLTSDPAVITNADGRIQVFVRGTDNALHTLAQKDPTKNEFGTFTSLGGGIGLSPALQVTNF